MTFILQEHLKKGLGLMKVAYGTLCGGPMAMPIFQFMESLEIPVYEIYGLTETCGIISLNRKHASKSETAGQLLDEEFCELKISPEGEIFYTGNNLFQGYFKVF